MNLALMMSLPRFPSCLLRPCHGQIVATGQICRRPIGQSLLLGWSKSGSVGRSKVWVDWLVKGMGRSFGQRSGSVGRSKSGSLGRSKSGSDKLLKSPRSQVSQSRQY